ncbi:MAG: hypothetical protein PHO44_04695 [Sphaerochaetaceae bacterium]|jgi:hypothetical protein|nr:hypothetical protein [Sphaerochaetaceae bacterium]MDD3162999.1 hypothetical protein [Sphaerochaetaceae bacterium]MDD4007259.1 hypothetical protein [Sphaerochaetaceae bacterium]MDD4396209.1 hypothetical protein [Sphaerochaetaceae bacterium]
MIGFFIKKSFFDGWDNFLSLLLFNLGYIICTLGILAILSYLEASSWITYLLIAVVLLVWCLYNGGVSGMVHQYSRYTHEGFAFFKKSLRKQLTHSLLYFAIVAGQILCCVIVIPFYLQSLQGMLGTILGVIVFWVVLFFALAMQYYYPLAQTMENDKPLKTLKKCFIILADNFGFSLFFALYNLINTALSIVLALMIPGVTGIMLSKDVAMKLLMFKYDYIEEHPELTAKERKHVPWDELLIDEKEKVGHRTFKGMIFPWKE